MNWSRIATAMAAACIAAYPASVMAADSTLVLVMGGEAYDGPPKFEVDFDGKTLGQGTLAAAIDTTSAGRFADAHDKTQYVQTFTFSVPEMLFSPQGDVTIRLLNGVTGTPGERSLYLASVSVNGRAVTASGLSTRLGDGDAPNRLLGEFLIIEDQSQAGVSKAPAGGWPQPVPVVAEAVSRAVAIASAPDLIQTGSIAGSVGVRESLQSAALDPDPEGGMARCDLSQTYNVIGFPENSNELTAKLTRRLDQVAADIGNRECKVLLTGYSSRQGAIASSALFAVERAQNSLSYLKAHGVRFVRAIATGAGATDQFGSDYFSNRRVVISVTP
jgi:outer membrane protein OmpA-like peptidoglycan-associated protein